VLRSLRDVLTAYALHDANVGYCQSLNYVAAMLLVALHFDAEAAFWMLVMFCEDLFPGACCAYAVDVLCASHRCSRFAKPDYCACVRSVFLLAIDADVPAVPFQISILIE